MSFNTETRFMHLSKKPIVNIYNVPSDYNFWVEKPEGLWFNKNNEWKDFCDSWREYFYEYQLDIDFDNFLIIDTFEKLQSLVENYYNPCTGYINWNEIASRYNGIYFDNYHSIDYPLGDRKYKWFSKIDISSGCIFRASSVKSFRQIEN